MSEQNCCACIHCSLPHHAAHLSLRRQSTKGVLQCPIPAQFLVVAVTNTMKQTSNTRMSSHCRTQRLSSRSGVPVRCVRAPLHSPRAAAATLDAAAASEVHKSAVELAPHVMVNSCTGRMGHAAAEAIVKAGLTLVPFTLTGYSAGVAVSNIDIVDTASKDATGTNIEIKVFKQSNDSQGCRECEVTTYEVTTYESGVAGIPVEVVGKHRRQDIMSQIREKHPRLIVVDYTTPNCVNDNAEFYAANGVPFVMGTTGGDPAKVAAAAEAAGVYAVVSPQMGKQVVAFQAMMELMAEKFPDVFSGYKLNVVESHQRNKADTSGTAKAVVQSFNKMGLEFKESQIRKIRDRESSLRMGVPDDALDGHAFHTYTVTSADDSVEFVFKHNVTGRSIYAEGTVDAVLFLAKQMQEGAEQKVYSMIDVLKAGYLR